MDKFVTMASAWARYKQCTAADLHAIILFLERDLEECEEAIREAGEIIEMVSERGADIDLHLDTIRRKHREWLTDFNLLAAARGVFGFLARYGEVPEAEAIEAMNWSVSEAERASLFARFSDVSPNAMKKIAKVVEEEEKKRRAIERVLSLRDEMGITKAQDHVGDEIGKDGRTLRNWFTEYGITEVAVSNIGNLSP